MDDEENPFAVYAEPAPAEDDNPFAQYARPSRKAPASDAVTKRRKAKGAMKVLRQIDAAGRGAADMLSLGFADEAAAAGNALTAVLPGGETYGEAYERNLDEQRAIDHADREDLPVSRGVGQGAGFVAGLGVNALANLGRFLPNALARGGAVATTMRAAGAGAGYGALAAAGNAEGTAGDRAAEAIPGAVMGGAFGAASVPLVGALGMGWNALRRNVPEIEQAANALRPRTNVGRDRQVAAHLRGAGVDPSFVSATDETGRAYVRAAASRMTDARDIVQQRAEAAALDLPDRLGRQARRHISPDTRSPDEIRATLATRRDHLAQREYAEPYEEIVEVPDAIKDMLADDAGRAIISRAREDAIENQDWVRQAELAALLEPTESGQLPRVSAATLDRLVIAARERGADFAEKGRNYRARGAFERRNQLDATLDDVEGLDEARGTYRDLSQQIEAANMGERFMRAPSDEFAAATREMTPEQLAVARATAARAVERLAGENVSHAPTVAKRLAYAPEQMRRNEALLSPDGARRLEESAAAEARIVRDLSDVAPRTGAQTQLRTADQEQASGLAAAAQQVGAAMTGGPMAAVGVVLARLKTAGLSDQQAQAVANIATDPRRLDELLAKIEERSPGHGRWLRTIINEAQGRQVGEDSVRGPAVEAYVIGRPELGVGRAYASPPADYSR